MGIRNYLIEGVSGSGKTTVATELQRRGYHVAHGDRELAYRGDPHTGEPLDTSIWEQNSGDPAFVHAHHLWDMDKVRSLLADRNHEVSFLCGGSRNFRDFVELLDGVFVLEIDQTTLNRRLDERSEDEFGGRPAERALIQRLHATKEDIPSHATRIDATRPVEIIVDDLLTRCGEAGKD